MDSCRTRGLVGAFVQENGIIRNGNGYIIGRLCEGVTIVCVNEVGAKQEHKNSESDSKKFLKVFLKAENNEDQYSAQSPEKFKDYLMDQHHLTVADVEICSEDDDGVYCTAPGSCIHADDDVNCNDCCYNGKVNKK